PDPSVRGVEKVRAVPVYLYPGFRFLFAVGVPADVRPALQDQHPQAQVPRAVFGDGQPEEAGSDDDEVRVHGLTGRPEAELVVAPSSGPAAWSPSAGSGGCSAVWPPPRERIGRYTARRTHQGISR